MFKISIKCSSSFRSCFRHSKEGIKQWFFKIKTNIKKILTLKRKENNKNSRPTISNEMLKAHSELQVMTNSPIENGENIDINPTTIKSNEKYQSNQVNESQINNIKNINTKLENKKVLHIQKCNNTTLKKSNLDEDWIHI